MSISNSPQFGTPDWQRGYYSAQKLLANVLGNQSYVNLTIPPNCETIVVVVPGTITRPQVTAKTGLTYLNVVPLAPYNPNTSAGDWIYLVDATDVINASLQITLSGAAPSQWWVYADSAAKIVADAATTRQLNNVPYFTPIAPSTASGDHPIVELQNVSGATSNGQILAPPGTGMRHRLFTAVISPVVSGEVVALSDSVSGVQLIYNPTFAPWQMSYLPSGYPISANAGLNVGSTSTDIAYSVTYTTEAV